MRHSTFTIGHSAVLIGSLLIACAAPQPREAQDVSEQIQTADAQFVEAFAAGDAQALASLYTEDGMLLPPNGDFVSGKAAIQGFWQAVMDAGVAEANLTVEEAQGLDGMAWEVGRYALHDAAGGVIDEGKYIVVWKKTEAGWRLHRDIWNSSRPM